MAEDPARYDLVASFFTLSGASFAEPSRHPFVERCRAAAAAGFSGIGLHADDLPRTLASGLDLAGMQAILADHGLRVDEIEFLGGWALATDPAQLESTVRRIEDVADAFGGRHVSAGEFRGDGVLDLDAAAARLDRLARRLADRGLQVAVEGFPWSVLAGPTAVPELLRLATAPNLGQLVDVWHFFNNGGDPASLRGPIAAVQLNDGPRVHEDFLRHARAARRLPGEGELDVVGLVRAVLRAGFTGPWCVEVNAPEFRALPIDEAAHRAAATAAAVLDAAGAPHLARLRTASGVFAEGRPSAKSPHRVRGGLAASPHPPAQHGCPQSSEWRSHWSRPESPARIGHTSQACHGQTGVGGCLVGLRTGRDRHVPWRWIGR